MPGQFDLPKDKGGASGQFTLKKKKINAFDLADKVGRQSKAFARNRDDAIQAQEKMLEGMERKRK